MEEKDFKSLVVEKARDIFVKYGYKKTAVNDIAKACNKSKGLIYHHYNSKEEIFKLVADNELKSIFIEIKKKIDPVKKAEEKMKVLLVSWYDFFSDKATLYNKIIIEIFDYLYIIKDMLETLQVSLYNIVKDILDEGVKNKEFKISDTDKTSTLIVNMINDISFNPIRHTLHLKSSDDINEFINIIFYGIIEK